jgi:hypothetical protein
MSTTEGHSHPSGAGQPAAGLLGGEVREGYAEVGDQRPRCVEAGEGPLVVLLHGFRHFLRDAQLLIDFSPRPCQLRTRPGDHPPGLVRR